MIANDFRDLRICETRILSDYGLLVVLAVKNKSCRMVCQTSRNPFNDSDEDDN